MMDIIVGCILIVGALFALLASIGIVRFPDLYTRMHSASKAGTLGSGLMLLALAIYSWELNVVSRALAGIVFFLLTTPIAGHLLARAAYISGTKPWSGTIMDDYKSHASSQK
ncbi:MAG: monovalent cation/H(+) antiporter subunit G [Cohaesibacter sp.]|nr:monovalent cation/H(+) antiporter subunit G [Cohaesibacter sp.]MCV6602244.1 monovalent cation/H(+) antiporter subunit G [Cohaesibacter sp.]